MSFSLLRCLAAPRGGAGGTRGTTIYIFSWKIRARPTEDVADVVDNDFGYSCLLLYPFNKSKETFAPL